MQDDTILQRIFAPENRPNPYPLLTELRRSPVSWQKGSLGQRDSYVVSSYSATSALLHDPRMSQDARKFSGNDGKNSVPQLSFIELDPPEHDRVRRLTMKHFGPPMRADYVDNLRPMIERSVAALIDDFASEEEVDIVKRIGYALPVSVICKILGVPEEDQPQFHVWVNDFTTDEPEKRESSLRSLHDYMDKLIRRLRENPKDDLISRMATDSDPDGRLEDPYIVATAVLLLAGGHETTANLIANGMLTLLRNPDILQRVRQQPEYIIGTVEELLRFEPPIQFLVRRMTLDAIEIGGTTIPKGESVILAIAAANRDPDKFIEPDRFNPERPDNTHLGFGSGVHHCFGAPLARLEAQIALREMARRMENPRLIQEPPAYRPSPIVRGIHKLRVAVSSIQK